MAIGRIQVNAGKKNKGKPHYNYVMAQDKYTKKKIELVYSQSGNMPDWAIDNPKLFWQMADEHERVNGTSYREHILTLPREFDLEQNLSLINEWIEKEIPNQTYSFAIHNPTAKDGKEQPHCHLMFSERLNDGIKRTPEQYFKRHNSKNPERGGVKKINTGLSPKERREKIKSLRLNWGEHLNNHLAKHNLTANIDMRNWKERGLSSPPINTPLSQYKMQERLIENISNMIPPPTQPKPQPQPQPQPPTQPKPQPKTPTSMYSLSTTGRHAQEPFAPYYHGISRLDIFLDALPDDFSSIKRLMAKYGADVYVSMCLGERAKIYGYDIPTEDTKEAFEKKILPEILIAEFSDDSELAQELIQMYCKRHGISEQDIFEQIEREKLEMNGKGMAQVITPDRKP